MKNKLVAYILLSGGIDSTACLHYCISQNYEVHPIFIDYGQLAHKKESDAVARICQYYSVKYSVIKCSFNRVFKGGEILGRNLFLLSNAIMLIKEKSYLYISIHAGIEYYDCSNEFFLKSKILVSEMTNDLVSLRAPFIGWLKNDIWIYCKKEKVPIGITYSCELGLDQPCENCQSCKDLLNLYANTK